MNPRQKSRQSKRVLSGCVCGSWVVDPVAADNQPLMEQQRSPVADPTANSFRRTRSRWTALFLAPEQMRRATLLCSLAVLTRGTPGIGHGHTVLTGPLWYSPHLPPLYLPIPSLIPPPPPRPCHLLMAETAGGGLSGLTTKAWS